MHISPCRHRNSCPHSSSRSQSCKKMHVMFFFSFLSHLVQFLSFLLLWCTCEHLITVSIWTHLLRISAFLLLCCFIWGWSECSGVFPLFLFLSFHPFSHAPVSSSICRPSHKQGSSPSLRFSLILCRMNFWWLEMSELSSSLCGRNIPPPHAPTPHPHSRYSVGKWTATKSFLAIILVLALCRQPHSVLRKLCVKEWLPRLLSRVLTPTPFPSSRPSDSPTFF